MKAVTLDNRLDAQLGEMMEELRTFVDSIQKPQVAEEGWTEAVMEGCEHLREGVEDLRQRLEVASEEWKEAFDDFSEKMRPRQEQARQSLEAIATSLSAYRQEVSESTEANVQALKEHYTNLCGEYSRLLVRLNEMKIRSVQGMARSSFLKPTNYTRNIFHATNGIVAVLLYHFVLTKSLALWIIGPMLGVFAFLEISRRFSTRWNDFLVDTLFGAIARPHERFKPNSATFYLTALVIICALFPKAAVEVAILVLALADPMASLVGKRFGRLKIYRDKSLVGTLTFFGVAFLASSLLLGLAFPVYGIGTVLLTSLLVALAGALAELFSTQIDDNFAVPVTTAFVAWLVL